MNKTDGGIVVTVPNLTFLEAAFIMYSLHNTHEMNAHRETMSIRSCTYYLSTTTERTAMTFCTGGLQQKLSIKFNFGPHQSNITPTLHVTETEHQQLSLKLFTVQTLLR